MKVQCGQCPAKYAVSDDRIRDKKVRIHCKRCNAAIVVDGTTDPPLITSTPAKRSARPGANTLSNTPTAPPPADTDPESRPGSPRPVAHTIMGGLEAPAAERLREAYTNAEPSPFATARGATFSDERSAGGMPSRGATDPPQGTNPNRWRVALTKQDLRWMTTEEITQAYAVGAVKLETFVFRTGMANWVTMLEATEIAEALARAGADIPAAYRAHATAVGHLSPSSMPPPRRAHPAEPSETTPSPGGASSPDADEGPEGESDEVDEAFRFSLVGDSPDDASGDANEPTRADAGSEGASPSTEARAKPEEGADEPSDREAPAAATQLPGGDAAGAGAHQATEAVPMTVSSTEANEANDPGASAAAAQPARSTAWIWILVVIILAVAAAAFHFAPRFGFGVR